MAKTALNAEVVARIVDYRRQGLTIKDCAALAGVAYGTLRGWLAEAADIAERRALHDATSLHDGNDDAMSLRDGNDDATSLHDGNDDATSLASLRRAARGLVSGARGRAATVDEEENLLLFFLSQMERARPAPQLHALKCLHNLARDDTKAAVQLLRLSPEYREETTLNIKVTQERLATLSNAELEALARGTAGALPSGEDD